MELSEDGAVSKGKGKGIPPLDAATAAVLKRGQAEFDALFTRIAPRFYRQEARERAKRYLCVLFAPVPRRNAWQLAELGPLARRSAAVVLTGAGEFCWYGPGFQSRG